MRKCWIRHFSNLGCYRGNRLRHTCQQLAYSSFIFDSVASWTWLLQRKRLPSSPTVRLWLSCGWRSWEFASVTWDKLQLFQLSSLLLQITLSSGWCAVTFFLFWATDHPLLMKSSTAWVSPKLQVSPPSLAVISKYSCMYRNIMYPFWKLLFLYYLRLNLWNKTFSS